MKISPDESGGDKKKKNSEPDGGDKKKISPPDGEGAAAMAAPATLIVNLPADAKLTVDGKITKSTSATRTFSSPPLELGRTYYYSLEAEVVRDGEPLRVHQEVAVQGGKETRVILQFPVAVVAQQ
jgi:uncharacterized protein (TIGR03000 family)